MFLKRTILTLLIGIFGIYTLLIYGTNSKAAPIPKKAITGKLVWQKYNCSACHQLYGLGGYLGPDLTNVISIPGKGEPIVRARLLAGTDVMPNFHLSSSEVDALVEYLKYMDATGKFPKIPTITGYGSFEF